MMLEVQQSIQASTSNLDKDLSICGMVFSTKFNVGTITYPEKYPMFTSLLMEVTALMSHIWRLCLDGNNKMRRSIHSLIDTDLNQRKSWFCEI